MLREALKISSPLALVSREVPRFHGGSLWHTTLGCQTNVYDTMTINRILIRRIATMFSFFLNFNIINVLANIW